MTQIFTLFKSIQIWAHAGLVALAFIGFQFTKSRLDESYSASKHPVDYATGQLSFDASKIESYYGNMLASGTLDIYWRTQYIDFAFIASVALLGIAVGSLLARGTERRTWTFRMAFAIAACACVGASFDVVENLLSFVMLKNPTAISQPLAIVYSTSAALKFLSLTIAMLITLLAVVWRLVAFLLHIYMGNR